MKRTILITIFIFSLFILAGCGVEIKEEPRTDEKILSVDQVDVIPDISTGDCLTQIRQTNPEMSDQAASDNCYTIEAINKNDKGLCDRVSAGFKANCLIQFEPQPTQITLTQTEPEGTPSVDQVDTIPDIGISDCLTQIKSTNPEMSDRAASDNCYTVEAINKNDKSLCDKVSSDFRANCLAQF
jgi:peroxiredoxin